MLNFARTHVGRSGRLSERGEIRFERYRPAGLQHGDGDPRWDLFETCLDVARRSWQGESTTGTTLSHENVTPFLRDVHQVAAETGSLDLSLLYIDDQPVAYVYNYFFEGYVYGLRTGYDEGFRKESVGNLLYMRVIEDSFARGDWLYDLGPGSLPAKRYIRTRLCPLSRLTHFPLGSLAFGAAQPVAIGPAGRFSSDGKCRPGRSRFVADGPLVTVLSGGTTLPVPTK